jgi:hypothetical protein
VDTAILTAPTSVGVAFSLALTGLFGRSCGCLLKVPLPDVVRMQTREPNLEGTGEISLRHLVCEALRMRPQRIVG